jgi:hypothetical protein
VFFKLRRIKDIILFKIWAFYDAHEHLFVYVIDSHAEKGGMKNAYDFIYFECDRKETPFTKSVETGADALSFALSNR